MMSTSLFLAMTLLNAAGLALGALVVRRLATARYGALPPISRMQSGFMALMGALVAAQMTLLGTQLISGAPISPLTDLLGGAIVLLLGVSNIYRARKHGEIYPSQRTLGFACLAGGTALLVIGGYRYAISLGTAGSWSLS